MPEEQNNKSNIRTDYIITESQGVPSVGFFGNTPRNNYEKYTPLDYDAFKKKCEESENKMSIMEIAWWLLKQSPKIIKLIYFIIKLTRSVMTNDKKTTILGYAKTLLAWALTAFASTQVKDPSGAAEIIVVAVGGIWGVVELITGIFTNKPDKK